MIHIIGANGYIGKHLCKKMESIGINFDCYSDIADSKCVEFNLTTSDYNHLMVHLH
jgi:nucleoside-diphosphate-sugar epimerase